ncbi:hypothetical protein P22_2591 [Propionispora sp. 2/2-37]|uniref:hypothetical protein n=1 Tax=Propionispora sp. 2/2-37 TaxID=1677858 RepID=UPI0006BB9183|nr:hypothetical protein [Propionispora sp. 2/2-37]CUH96501.1 hypothetical protein P22_2591 [Propionispora sp. 2/2-37]
MQIGEPIDMHFVKHAVADCCCSVTHCESCAGRQCLIGFAKLIAEYATTKKTLSIPNGMTMAPLRDTKTYDIDNVIMALAAINLSCKNCMDNHDDNCAVNILRYSLEVALLGQHIDFGGNPLSYILAIAKIDAETGDKVLRDYNLLKQGLGA